MAFDNLINMEKKRRFKLLMFAGLFVLGVAILVIYMAKTPATPPPSAQITKSRPDAISGQAGGAGSQEYNRKVQENDNRNANEALAGGQSYVPTPIGNKKGVVGKKEETKSAPPAVARVKTVPVQTPRPDNSLQKRMLEDLAALDAKLSSVSVGNGKIIYEKDFSKEQQNASTPVVASIQENEKTAAATGLKPGDLLYAIIDTGVNSDVPSAVMATVAQGEYRNARMLGGFQRHDERMVLAFSRAILPSGKSIQVEAYAVDPDTSEASVASSVDTHFFSRWGGLVASAFLEGLGSAKKFSGATSTMYGYGNNSSDQMVWDNYSPEDQAWIAAGKVGEKASKIFEKNFDRPPTVYLDSGSPVGILIINVKEK